MAVKVYEFGFTNVYGTDITAAREVEHAHAENDTVCSTACPSRSPGDCAAERC